MVMDSKWTIEATQLGNMISGFIILQSISSKEAKHLEFLEKE